MLQPFFKCNHAQNAYPRDAGNLGDMGDVCHIGCRTLQHMHGARKQVDLGTAQCQLNIFNPQRSVFNKQGHYLARHRLLVIVLGFELIAPKKIDQCRFY